jgi:hypothetical protein
MSYGELPSREAFSEAFDRECPEGTFSFGNDPYVGTDVLNETQLWRELEAQHATFSEWECPGDCDGSEDCPVEAAGSWCSSVLGCLGFDHNFGNAAF